MSSSNSSGSSSFSFCRLTSSLDDIPFSFSSPERFVYDHKDDDFGCETGAATHSSILVEDQSPVENFLPNKNVTFEPTRKRDLKIQVPKLQIQDRGFSPNTSLTPNSRVNHTESQTKWHDDVKRQSHPLPLPPAAISNSSHASCPNSAAKSPSMPLRSPEKAAKSPSTLLRSPERAEKSPSTPLRSPERAEKSPSMRLCSPERAENVKKPGSPWKRGKLIGRGPLGDVYLGFNSEKGRMCAMKKVRLSSDDTEFKPNERLLEKEEIALLCRIQHPNIVQFYGSETVADNFYIFFEYVSGGSIDMILQQYGRLGEPAIRRYTQQILSGLAYLHSKHIVHRDIKCANILVDPNGRIKLINFGIEKHIAKQSRTSWLMDSPYWMAPEAIMNPNACNLAIDIWSLGCTVLEMATSKPPLSQYDRVMALQKVAYHELPTIPDHLSDVCKDFLKHCLQWDPLHRATASQLLKHPFVNYSLPLGKQILFSTSSGHPATTNAVRSEGIDHARSHHQLDSGKVAFRSYEASKSNYQTSDIYTPRNISPPVSPVSPLVHPRSPQHLNGRMSPPPKTSPHMVSTPIIGGVGAVPHSHIDQSMLQQETSPILPKQSANIKSPSYWDPNILRGLFRFS